MVDTVVLLSPEIADNIKLVIENFCTKRLAYDIGTGNIFYEFTSADLLNSSDNRISLRLTNERWVRGKDDKTAHKEVGAWHLRVETSVHKQMLGHNIFGGSSDFQLCIKWLVRRLETILGVILPSFEDWIVQRIDFAEVFNLGSELAVKAWFKSMNNAEYTRRLGSVGRFGYTGLYFPGASTTLKFYHKGTEFRKHDRPKVRKFLDITHVEKLQKIADSLLRIEVEIKSKKLKYDFGKLPLVKDISKEYLVNLFDVEVSRVLKLFGDDVKVARKADDVEKLLYEVYAEKPLLAGKLLGTWYRLSTKPESEVRQYIPERTLRRHKKLLLDAGCSWVGSDVIVVESDCPLDFQPVRTDRHYFGLVLQEVQTMLEQIA